MQPLLKEEPLANKLLKKGFWLYIFAYLIWPAGYLTRVILSNSLSVSDIWILYSIMGFLWLLSSYSGLGLGWSLSYFLPKYYIQWKFDSIKTSIIMNIVVQAITTFIIIAILRFGANWLSIHYFHSPEAALILKYLCFYFLGLKTLWLLQKIFISFQGTFHFKSTDFVRVTSILFFTLLFFLLSKWNIITYSLSWIFGIGVALILAINFFIKKYKHLLQWPMNLDSKEIKTFWKYSLWTFLGMNAAILMGQIDQQMVVILMWPKSAGLYSNYLSLWQISTIIIWPIFWLLFPLFTELLERKDNKKTKILQDFLYTYLTTFAISMSILFFVLGPEIATILFWIKFIDSWYLLQFSALFLFIWILLNVNFSLLAAMGEIKKKVKILWIAAIINVSLNLLLIPLFGLYWVLIATIVWSLFMLIYSNNIIKKRFPISRQKLFLGKNIFLFVFLWIIIYLIKDKFFVLDNNYRYINLITISLISIIYYILIWIFNYKRVIVLKKQVLQILKQK